MLDIPRLSTNLRKRNTNRFLPLTHPGLIMSSIPHDKEFYELADAHISLCNEHLAAVKPAKVSAAMLFAASRFNAFVIYAASENKAQLLLEKEAAIGYFMQEYEKNLRENIDEHLKRYENQ